MHSSVTGVRVHEGVMKLMYLDAKYYIVFGNLSNYRVIMSGVITWVVTGAVA